MKKLTGFVLVLMMTLIGLQTYIFANTTKIEVDLRVEGIKETLMEGKVEADTLIKSIQKLGEQSNVAVILKSDSRGQVLYSIGGIEYKKYNINDEWKGFIIRDNQEIEVDNIMNTKLINNDKIVLYYGNIEDTKIVTTIKETYLDGELWIELSSSIVTWVESNGIWRSKTVENKLKDINIHSVMPNGEEVIRKTDESGIAQFKTSLPNAFTYYAEGYRQGSVPLILKVQKNTKILGLKNEKEVTRAEFIALLVNHMGIGASELEPKAFTDVTEDTLYRDQIKIAQSLGIISGDGDGTFRPEQKITMQELALILDNTYKDKPILVESVNLENLKGADVWAIEGIKSIVQKGIITDTDIDWKRYVDSKVIVSIIEKAIKK